MSLRTKFLFQSKELVTTEKLNAISRLVGRTITYAALPPSHALAVTGGTTTYTLVLHAARAAYVYLFCRCAQTMNAGDYSLQLEATSTATISSNNYTVGDWLRLRATATPGSGVTVYVRLQKIGGSDPAIDNIVIFGSDEDLGTET